VIYHVTVHYTHRYSYKSPSVSVRPNSFSSLALLLPESFTSPSVCGALLNLHNSTPTISSYPHRNTTIMIYLEGRILSGEYHLQILASAQDDTNPSRPNSPHTTGAKHPDLCLGGSSSENNATSQPQRGVQMNWRGTTYSDTRPR
jgi:hypothetical protein